MASIIKTLNIGTAKTHDFFGKTITTGICKEPVTNPVLATTTGFVGDGIHNTKYHGGADKAICVYPEDHLEHWQKLLGIPLPTAPFGENLSISTLAEGDVHIGDIFRIGQALVQVSQPRQPCKTLAIRYNKPNFVKTVVQSGFTGWYLRVLEEGLVQQGDSCVLESSDLAKISIAFANQVMHHDRKNKTAIGTILAIKALSTSWQESLQELFDKAE
jgi:MOSC domain-containing protein YiiM